MDIGAWVGLALLPFVVIAGDRGAVTLPDRGRKVTPTSGRTESVPTRRS